MPVVDTDMQGGAFGFLQLPCDNGPLLRSITGYVEIIQFYSVLDLSERKGEGQKGPPHLSCNYEVNKTTVYMTTLERLRCLSMKHI